MAGVFHDVGFVDGTLTSSSSLVACVTRPDGITLNSDDHPTQVRVTLGLDGPTAMPAELAAELDLTEANNTDGTGLAKVEFRLAIDGKSTRKAAGDWDVTVVHSGNGADGAAGRTIVVRQPKAAFRWTAGTTIS